MRRGFTRTAKTGDDIYQAGGDFLLDSAGRVLFAHRSRDPADRPAVSRLLHAVDQAESGQVKAEN
jgi:hypothetical protein